MNRQSTEGFQDRATTYDTVMVDNVIRYKFVQTHRLSPRLNAAVKRTLDDNDESVQVHTVWHKQHSVGDVDNGRLCMCGGRVYTGNL